MSRTWRLALVAAAVVLLAASCGDDAEDEAPAPAVEEAACSPSRHRNPSLSLSQHLSPSPSRHRNQSPSLSRSMSSMRRLRLRR